MIKTINKHDNRDKTMWPISKLTPHTQQGQLLFDVSEIERNQLRDSIEREGQRTPIEITPEGGIIDGHQRVDVFKELGETAVWVVVRDDLTTPEAVETRFLEANLVRRQLDPLGKVRVAVRLYELADVGQGKSRGEIEKEIAKRLNMNDRTFRRYRSVAKTPRVVQEAFGRGELTLVEAEGVASLPDDTQQEIAERITEGEAPKSVIKAYGCKKSAKSVDPVDNLLGCARKLREAITALPFEVDTTDMQLAELETTRKELHVLIKQLGI